MSQRGRIEALLPKRAPKGQGSDSGQFPLALTVKRPFAARYDLVPIVIRTYRPDGKPYPLAQPPSLVVLRGGVPVPTVGHVEHLAPTYNRRQAAYVAYWPVPWDAPLGDYTVEARCDLARPAAWSWDRAVKPWPADGSEDEREAEAIARARLVVSGRQPPKLRPGLCAVTWEDHPPTGKVRRPDGKMGDWRAVVDWAQFMGADTLWVRGAITQVGRGYSLSMNSPFAPDEKGVRRLAAEAHARGLHFGVWAVAYATFPRQRNAGKPPYKYSQVLTPSGSLVDGDFISLLDPDRPRHLADFLHSMAANPDVDMVGLDYFRPDKGGYEAVDGFVHRMPVELPPGLLQKSRLDQIRYVANIVEHPWRGHRDLYEEWKWYQAHLVAERLRDIVDLARLSKPLFVFTFGWSHGDQSGQDPLMLTDAGADALAVMLYQVSSPASFDLMVRQWGEYLKAGQANIIPGDQLDFYWHQKMTQPRAAPEELYRRMVSAERGMEAKGKTVGVFFHDISRAAVSGRRGPYPGREWALAGGAAFSALRRSWGVYPLTAEVVVPKTVQVGAPFTAKLRLHNLSSKPIADLKLTLEDTEDVSPLEARVKSLAELPARGEVTVPWSVKISALNAARASRFMVAARVNWPDGDYGPTFRRDLPRTIIAMKYLNAR